MEISFFDSDNVDLYQGEVDAILLVLGHPEAIVTDESALGDFIPYYLDKESQDFELEAMAAYLKKPVRFSDKIWELAKGMRDG